MAKKYSDGQDIGYVGEVTEVNEQIIYDLLEKDFLPINFVRSGMDGKITIHIILMQMMRRVRSRAR